MAPWILLQALLFVLFSHCGGGESSSAVKFDLSPSKSGVKVLADAVTGITSRDVTIDPATGVAVCMYLPSLRATTKVPVLVYFHGGAFISGSAFSPVYNAYVSTLAATAGVVAVSVNYRLAQENPLPAAFEDSWAALKWVLANAGTDPWLSRYGDLSRLFLAGDSSGGNIAHSLGLRAGEKGLEDGAAKIKGMALLDPYFLGWSAAGTSSFVCTGKYPCANPLTLTTTSWQHLGCSRVLVTVAGQDRLAPRQRAYYSTLRSSGWAGQDELYETPGDGEGHVYFLDKLSTPHAQAEMATLAAFINRD